MDGRFSSQGAWGVALTLTLVIFAGCSDDKLDGSLTADSASTPPTSASDVQLTDTTAETDAVFTANDGAPSTPETISADVPQTDVVGDTTSAATDAVTGAVDSTGGGASTSTQVGPAGGLVKGPGGVQLAIPPGALSEPVVIEIAVLTAPADTKSFAYTTPTISLKPDGLQLAASVTLTLVYDPTKLPKDVAPTLQVVHYLAAKGALMAGMPDEPPQTLDVHDVPSAQIDSAAKTISVPLWHFSNYAAGATAGHIVFQTQQSGPDALRVIGHSNGFASTTARSAKTSHIVLHHTDRGKPDKPVSLVTQFTEGWNRVKTGSPSAQWWIGRNGVIGQTVALDGLAYHAGYPANQISPGIEMLNDDTQNWPLPQRLAVRRLVSFLLHANGLPTRGRWQADWPAGPRAVPPGFDPTQTAPAGSSPPHYDRVLGHREVDRHIWITRAYFHNWNKIAKAAGTKVPTRLVYTSNVNGYFKRSIQWHCKGGWSSEVAAGGGWTRKLKGTMQKNGRRDVEICFRPVTVMNINTSITITVQAQYKSAAGTWANTGGQAKVTYSLDGAPTEGSTSGTSHSGWRPGLSAGRRRRDPGGDHEFAFEALMTDLAYDHTGIIDASGGDSYKDKRGGKGGKVVISTGYTFKANHFDTAEALYLNNQNPKTDEATQGYIKHIKEGASEQLDVATYDCLWLLVEGTLHIKQNTAIRAALGIYVAPGGKIVARPTDPKQLDGLQVELETLGEALIYGSIDARGRDAPLTGTGHVGGDGGDVTIRQLAANHTPIPTIVSRGGDTDEASNKSAPGPPGGDGGAVEVTATGPGARIVLTGGEGPGNMTPAFEQAHLAPAPPMNISTKNNPWTTLKSGDRPGLFYAQFKRGICTSGGMGGHWGQQSWHPGSKGGAGGSVTINAASIASNGAALWTGAGLEHFLVRVPVNTVTGTWPAYVSFTGGHGGSGRIGTATVSGEDGGDGGDAGDITITGAYHPEKMAKGKVTVAGWNGQKAQDFWQTSAKPGVIGACNTWSAALPGNAVVRELLRICAVGGSGGHPGGSYKKYSGNFGKKGSNATVTGAPP